MTKRLLLIRHAKSSWGDPTAGDHARPLNARGQQAATAIGQWLLSKGDLPDQILSSDSARTRETVARMTAGWPEIPDIQFQPSLYLVGPSDLLAALHLATGERVALVAHNPGIADFADQMARQTPSHGRFFDYPTGATTILDFDILNWNDATPGKGRVVDFIVPRDLTD